MDFFLGNLSARKAAGNISDTDGLCDRDAIKTNRKSAGQGEIAEPALKSESMNCLDLSLGELKNTLPNSSGFSSKRLSGAEALILVIKIPVSSR